MQGAHGSRACFLNPQRYATVGAARESRSELDQRRYAEQPGGRNTAQETMAIVAKAAYQLEPGAPLFPANPWRVSRSRIISGSTRAFFLLSLCDNSSAFIFGCLIFSTRIAIASNSDSCLVALIIAARCCLCWL